MGDGRGDREPRGPQDGRPSVGGPGHGGLRCPDRRRHRAQDRLDDRRAGQRGRDQTPAHHRRRPTGRHAQLIRPARRPTGGPRSLSIASRRGEPFKRPTPRRGSAVGHGATRRPCALTGPERKAQRAPCRCTAGKDPGLLGATGPGEHGPFGPWPEPDEGETAAVCSTPGLIRSGEPQQDQSHRDFLYLNYSHPRSERPGELSGAPATAVPDPGFSRFRCPARCSRRWRSRG
ncbi:hypothetical protein SCOCK_150099 [Actinacidiphila cocklensis]|uniref:Uncharacterized protein n=1 Tax=Actinacidiphila cocklensis TaxID=887465 RepID=A0A9W4GR08_9ACTN|nr:hypothetical protein SCOCK_150099 [Actinacidiphila cocklensis]